MSATRDRRVLALYGLVTLVLLGLQFALPPFHHAMLTRILVLAAYATGYNLLLGYTGLMSLGHAMLFASGMYATGLAVVHWGWGAAPALLGGLAGSLLVSVGLGLLALRTSGVSFLIVTMMFSQVFYLGTLHFNRVTMGEQGFVLSGRLDPIELGGLRLAWSDPRLKYNAALVLFSLVFALTLWLKRSPIGRVLVAIRENEERTRMLGYNTFNYKLLALVLSGAISGISGSAYALLFSYVGSTFASILYSIYPLLWTLLGGAGTAVGPLAGTLVMVYVEDIARTITPAYLIVVGAALVVIIMWMPVGIMGRVRSRWWRWLP